MSSNTKASDPFEYITAVLSEAGAVEIEKQPAMGGEIARFIIDNCEFTLAMSNASAAEMEAERAAWGRAVEEVAV